MLVVPPSDWLSNMGIAEFEKSAAAGIRNYSNGWAQRNGNYAQYEWSFRAFVEFGAVEFALLPYFGGAGWSLGDSVFPVRVTDKDSLAAIFKTDCGPFMEHVWKDPGQLRPWDLFAFAGDMSKAELLGFSEDVNVLGDSRAMLSFLYELAERYSSAGVRDRIVNSGLLAAQGLVWQGKLAALRGDDYMDDGAANFQMFQNHLGG